MENKYFVPIDRALKLEELGFYEVCDYYYIPNGEIRQSCGIMNYPKKLYPDYIKRPLFCQIFNWFRENHGLSNEIHLKMSNNRRKIWYNINELDNRLIKSMYFKNYPKGFFSTYEEAELDCLDKLIEICEKSIT